MSTNEIDGKNGKPREGEMAELHPLLKNRWSPCSFSQKQISDVDLRSIVEAGRWAPSSFNEQPWRFLVATSADPAAHARVLRCLLEANQTWARNAPVLMLTFAATTFLRNGNKNLHCKHDVGAAVAMMTIQAMSLGIFVHQMAGILPDVIASEFDIPAGFEPVTGIAMGFLETDESKRNPESAERDRSVSRRRPLDETFFATAWSSPHPITSRTS